MLTCLEFQWCMVHVCFKLDGHRTCVYSAYIPSLASALTTIMHTLAVHGITAVLCGLVASGTATEAPHVTTVAPPKDAKNVLMFVVDDMRAQMNKAYGQEVGAVCACGNAWVVGTCGTESTRWLYYVGK